MSQRATDAILWLPYAQMQTALAPLEVCTTQGSNILLTDGRQLIDGVASWWTACHGYNHPHLIQAIQSQAAKLSHVMLGGLVHPQALRLSQRLATLLGADLRHVFFSESGSVAVEIAMKMALQYWLNYQQPQRNQFIHFQHGYHGDTFFTMSVCDPEEGMHHLFKRILPPQHCHTFPTTDPSLAVFEDWLKLYSHTVAAMIVEPLVQGAGGMRMHSATALQALCELCQRYDILVIMDEIFTGFGRTGTLFAIQQFSFVPDIICLGKALTGGMLPLAATIARAPIYEAFLSDDPTKALMHGTTFMGNALACAAANASLDLFENEPRIAQVAAIEKILQENLAPLSTVPGVKAVRIKGAIGAVQLERPLGQDVNWFKTQFIQDGVWCRPLGDVVYTTPAFTIESTSLMKITDSICKNIRQWSTLFYPSNRKTVCSI